MDEEPSQMINSDVEMLKLQRPHLQDRVSAKALVVPECKAAQLGNTCVSEHSNHASLSPANLQTNHLKLLTT